MHYLYLDQTNLPPNAPPEVLAGCGGCPNPANTGVADGCDAAPKLNIDGGLLLVICDGGFTPAANLNPELTET